MNIHGIGISKLTIIGAYNNGVSPGQCQAIIYMLTEPLVTKFSQILIELHTLSFKKVHLKMLPVKWLPFCLARP